MRLAAMSAVLEINRWSTRWRGALEEIARRPIVERNPDGEDQAAASMRLIAREALSVPSVLDREQLIQAGAQALRATGQQEHLQESAEVVLRAVGLIP